MEDSSPVSTWARQNKNVQHTTFCNINGIDKSGYFKMLILYKFTDMVRTMVLYLAIKQINDL